MKIKKFENLIRKYTGKSLSEQNKESIVETFKVA